MLRSVRQLLRDARATRAGARRSGLRARIDEAVAGGLADRLGLSGWRIASGHYLHLLGDSRSGRLFVAFFPEAEAARARRIVAATRILADAGLCVPEVVDAEPDPGASGIVWVASRYCEGSPLDPRNPGQARHAMAELARIHAIARDGLDGPIGDRAADLDAAPELRSFRERVGALARSLERLGVVLAREDRDRVAAVLEAGVAAMLADRRPPPAVLLHGDFQPPNLRLGPDGRLWILDLESAAFGAFVFDLARTLFRFRFRVKDVELDRLPVCALLADARVEALERAYLAGADPESARFWRRHRRTVLFYGHLRATHRRAQAAANPRRSGALARRRAVAQARARWRLAVRYAEGAGSTT